MSNCKEFFGLDAQYFDDRSCINTASEIAGQVKLLLDLSKMLVEKKQLIADFINDLRRLADLRRKSDMFRIRIILTGAGSSAFIGEALAPFIAKSTGLKCEAIHTTDIVSAPDTILFSEIPTLLVSFARSGNSPESVGAVQYARKKIKHLYEAVIVCDGTSKLARIAEEKPGPKDAASLMHDAPQGDKKNLVLVMPEGSNDRGFAMTSSVSCMLLAGFALFNHERIDEIAKDIVKLSENISASGPGLSRIAQGYAKKPFDRAIYLASGAFKGLAHEGSLKMMELSNGAVNTNFDSAAGFRHGPKSVIKDNTLTLHFISNDPFTAQYDIDLLKEVYREKGKNIVTAICPDNIKNIEVDDIITVNSGGYGIAADICIGIHSLVFYQLLALHKSLELGITTDNPSPGGQVNRVVKGVIVYPYEGK